jgi:hypothetical protein
MAHFSFRITIPPSRSKAPKVTITEKEPKTSVTNLKASKPLTKKFENDLIVPQRINLAQSAAKSGHEVTEPTVDEKRTTDSPYRQLETDWSAIFPTSCLKSQDMAPTGREPESDPQCSTIPIIVLHTSAAFSEG